MMSWNYSNDPAASDVDRCRFLIGDTDQRQPIMQDEEIQYIIATYKGNNNALMYNLFIRASTLLARDIKRSLGPQSEDPTDRLRFYEDQAKMYKARLTSGGLSLPVYAHPQVFGIGMHNNPPHVGGRYV